MLTQPNLEIDPGAVEELRTNLRGPLLQPGDDGYDDARSIWNAMIDRRPALIARCTGVADVIAAVNFARDQGLLLSVKGGGHNVSGKAVCDGGLMIDLSPMKGIHVDPMNRTARAEAGVLWGELDRETHVFGLATPGGTVDTTGIAGLTLGGGQSWLTGKYGFTMDNVLSVDLVTADGQFRVASEETDPDLFWAVRGAGHNFGVATSFEYRLHPVSTVLGGMLIHPMDRAADVLRFIRQVTAEAPDELTVIGGILTAPDGNLVAALVVCYSGDLEEGERYLAPIRAWGPPLADTIAPIPHPVMQGLLGPGFPYGRHNYWKTGLTGHISDEAIETIVDHALQVPSPFAAIVIFDLHGAGQRVGKTEMAYYHRDLRYDILTVSAWLDASETERNVAWVRGTYDDLKPQLSGAYINDLDYDEADRVASAYGENYPRLVELKRRYDPTNLFRLNQNIKP